MSERSQKIIIWWGWIFMIIYGCSIGFLMGMVPTPPATLTPVEVTAFYTENNFSIRLGAMICSWTAAFMVPIAVVIYIQMLRLEKGAPVWSVLQLVGGVTMSMFLVFPPIVWGAAAFSVDRLPDATAALHDLGTLTLVTTDQFYIFQMIAITYLSLQQKKDDPLNPFPRWMGYFTLWAALAFEVGALAFMTKTGPFAWNGAFVFWMPFIVFGCWLSAISWTMLRALSRQQAANIAAGITE